MIEVKGIKQINRERFEKFQATDIKEVVKLYNDKKIAGKLLTKHKKFYLLPTAFKLGVYFNGEGFVK